MTNTSDLPDEAVEAAAKQLLTHERRDKEWPVAAPWAAKTLAAAIDASPRLVLIPENAVERMARADHAQDWGGDRWDALDEVEREIYRDSARVCAFALGIEEE